MPELDDYLRPAEARKRFSAVPYARIIAVDGAKHLWVGEKHVRRVLDDIVSIVSATETYLPEEVSDDQLAV